MWRSSCFDKVVNSVCSGGSEGALTGGLISLTAFSEIIRHIGSCRDAASLSGVVGQAVQKGLHSDAGVFVLREGDQVHYVEVSGRDPLWKGRRFPLSRCISGWVILNRAPVAIENVAADARIPYEIYRPTWVRSLLMVPIRTDEPVGALGAYWADTHKASAAEMEFLRNLADITACAFTNVTLYENLRSLNADLDRRVTERTERLAEVLQELDDFAQHVAHDLRAPLRAIRGLGQIALEEADAGADPAAVRERVREILRAAERMDKLVVDLLSYSRLARQELPRSKVSLDLTVDEVLLEAGILIRESKAQVDVERPLGDVVAYAPVLKQVLQNLLSNAIKFVAPGSVPRVRIYAEPRPPRRRLWVEDHGIGIPPQDQERIFRAFERLHPPEHYPGTGIGLAFVSRAVGRLGGAAGVESEPGKGSRFWIELPEA